MTAQAPPITAGHMTYREFVPHVDHHIVGVSPDLKENAIKKAVNQLMRDADVLVTELEVPAVAVTGLKAYTYDLDPGGYNIARVLRAWFIRDQQVYNLDREFFTEQEAFTTGVRRVTVYTTNPHSPVHFKVSLYPKENSQNFPIIIAEKYQQPIVAKTCSLLNAYARQDRNWDAYYDEQLAAAITENSTFKRYPAAMQTGQPMWPQTRNPYGY